MRISDWSSDVCSSDLSTLATPAAAAACSATGPALLPATSTCTSPPSLAAAAMAFRVAPFRWALSCSAITSVVILEHLRFVLELVDQRGHVGHLDAGLARRRIDALDRKSGGSGKSGSVRLDLG